MSNPIQRAVRQKFISQRTIHGVDVVYSDGTNEFSIDVIPARTGTQVLDSETNTQLRSFVRDFLILREDLEDDDEVQVWPEAGHTITDASDGSVYQVVRDLHGEPGWRWDDQLTKQVMRVHTQIIAGT